MVWSDAGLVCTRFAEAQMSIDIQVDDGDVIVSCFNEVNLGDPRRRIWTVDCAQMRWHTAAYSSRSTICSI